MRPALLALSVFILSQTLFASLQVKVQSSVPSPQLVGTEVIFTFSAKDTNIKPGILNYRFEVATPENPQFIIMHDFEVAGTFKWARNLVEGTYHIRVTARDSNYLTQPSQIVIPYVITSRVTGTTAVVSGTTHPLVALFSAPRCLATNSIRIVFHHVGSASPPSITNFVPCTGSTSQNFLIGGMAASSAYAMFAQVGVPGGTLTNGTAVTWTTGSIPSSLQLVTSNFPIPFGPKASQPERLSLISFDQKSSPYAMGTSGTIDWYYAGDGAHTTGAPADAEIMRVVTGGYMLTSCSYVGSYTGTGIYGNQFEEQSLQLIDLTGHVVSETNVDRVNEQLLALGTDPISTFNHDARILSNGHVIAIASPQKIYPAGTQGSTKPIDILGTMLVELDQNFQVVWFWNAFDHASGNGQLDINRADPLHEQCTTSTAGTIGCPPVLLSSPANDWLHTNTVQYLPLDGSLIISIRDQDWVAKIDYNNGLGTGNILWIMGQGGTFAMNNVTGDQWPWFSHQHDVEFQDSNDQVMTMFDNGNTRNAVHGGNSRGYVLKVDQGGLQVTPLLLANLGYYAGAQGSAQVLSNGDYEFLGGQIFGTVPSGAGAPPAPSYYEASAEVTPAGVAVYSQNANSAAYRLWRMTDFYNVPLN